MKLIDVSFYLDTTAPAWEAAPSVITEPILVVHEEVVLSSDDPVEARIQESSVDSSQPMPA
jgi:hypothetical protein